MHCYTMRIYLDNAATSFPKRPGVVEAVRRYSQENGAAVGRGTSSQAVELQRSVDRCRRLAANVLGAPDPSRIVFCFNGTDALNLAILGLCRPGDHVITSMLEHNSVLRPLRYLSDQRQVQVSYVTPNQHGRIDPAAVRRELRPETRLVVLTHASNVTGTIQPVADVAEVLRGSNTIFLVDAAQTAGHVEFDSAAMGLDLVACSGHKGLGGPLGTGLLYVGPGLEQELVPLRFGGTGSQSESDQQPETMPDRYESGNHNAPGIVGLATALEHVAGMDYAEPRARERTLTARLIEEFRAIPGVTVHVPGDLEHQLGVVSISVEGFEPHVFASLLDQEFGVQTRAGLHCAPRAHEWLGTLPRGGTIRFSLGHATTLDEILAAVEAVRTILGG
jgi:cysteine desulfurase/selenocysteine lyase